VDSKDVAPTKVRRYDYAAQFGDDLDELVDDLKSILLSGEYILSEEVGRFESAFADFIGVRHARATNSGTDALIVGFRAVGIQPGDEIITHANTFYATVAAIVLAGGRPVLVDADDRSFLIDIEQAKSAVTGRTRALLPVHLYGKPTPMEPMLAIGRERDLLIVEDAAQAHGASIGGKRAGSFGTFAAFSFHPSKNLSAAGDAGALVTESDDLAHAVEAHRNLGQWVQNDHRLLGINSKMDAIQARVLFTKLKSLERWTSARNEVAQAYRELLHDLPVTFQSNDLGEVHAYHLFQVRTDRRDALAEHLRGLGIDVVVRYPTPIHLQPAFSEFGWRKGEFPVAERLAQELLCLPIRPDMPESEIVFVVNGVREYFGGTPT
jgi:dTDP-4-amino-4,6-dideoxygalactose transaminase